MPNNATCSLCGAIPATLTVQTGNDERFPDAVYALKRLDIDRNADIYRCPECYDLFHWERRRQSYVSGKPDEESLTRLSDDVAGALRPLLDLHFEFEDAVLILSQTFELIPRSLRKRILMRLGIYTSEEFAPVIDLIVDRFVLTNDPALREVITGYCGNDQELMWHVVNRIQGIPTNLGFFERMELRPLVPRHWGVIVTWTYMDLISRLHPRSGGT